MKKALKITGIALGAILILLLVAPFVFKGKIVQAIKNTANKQLNATLNFDNNIDLSFLRSFPNVSLEIKNLSIVGKDSFVGDTLVYFPEMRLTLDVMSAIKGEEIKIKRIYLKAPKIDIETMKSGRANWDIVKTDTTKTTKDTGGSTFKMALKSLEIEKGHLIYDDKSLNFFTELKEFDHTSSGDFTTDNFMMETKTQAKSLTLGYGGVNWLFNIGTEILANIQMDLKSWKFSFDKGKVKLNDLNIESDGFVDLNDNDIDMDIKFKALENTFKSFLSLVPGMYQNNFKDLQASGTMGFGGFIKGKMTDDKMPSTDVSLKINNGGFKYPSLQFPADNINLDLHFTNPDGTPDKSIVDVQKLNLSLAGEPFAMKLLLKTPVSDPYIDGNVKGKIDLSKIVGLIPLEKGTKLAGLIDADLSAKGNYSAANSKNYSKLNADGKLLVKNLIYQGASDKDAYQIENLELNFTPQAVKMPVCIAQIGKNDFNVKGKIENFLGYAFAGETLKGEVDLESKYINANSFLSDKPSVEDPKVADTAALTIVEIPSNLDISLNTKINKLVYDNYILTDLGGHTRIQNSQLNLENLRANLLGGTIKLDGTYDSKNAKNPFTNMSTKIERMNFSQTFAYFPMLSKFAPIAKMIDGLFNANIDLSSILNDKMQLNYNSMNVNGMVSFTDAAVKNLDVVKQIASQLKINWLENLQIKNQTVKFQIKEGIFKLLDSFTIPLGQGAVMRLAGMTKLNQTLSYGGWIKIPRKAMGAANSVVDGWVKQAATKGWKLDVAEMIPVDLNIGGTILKPLVSLGLKGFKQNIVDNLKDQGKAIIKGEANKKLAEGLKIAQAQADKIKAEAKDKADKLRAEGIKAGDAIRAESKKRSGQIMDEGDKAYQRVMDETNKQADNIIASASNPIEKQAKKIAADKLRKEGAKKANDGKAVFYKQAAAVEEEGNKKADQVESEANKRADEVENGASTRADKIMKDAEAKSKL